MFYSVHMYGAEVQLLQWDTDSLDEAKTGLITLMDDVDFNEVEDEVLLFSFDESKTFGAAVPCKQSEAVFNYRDDYFLNQEDDK